MTALNIRLNEDQLRRVRFILGDIENGASRALASALNRTAARGKTLASSKLREQVRLTAAYVRERLKGPNDTPANRATFSNLTAKITAPHRGLLLSHFLREGVNTPVTSAIPKVKVKPPGSYQTIGTRPGNIGSSFLIRLKNSNVTGIAQRMSSPGPRGGIIDVLHGPSLSQVLRSRSRLEFQSGSLQGGVIDAIGPELNETLARNLDAEIVRVLERFGSG